MKITIPRRWFLIIAGLANWQEQAKNLPYSEFIEVKNVINNYISRMNKDIRKRGGLVTSLFWSQENLAPSYLLEATRMNEKFLKELRAQMNNISERILASLTSEERSSNLGKNIAGLSLEGKIVILNANINTDEEYFPQEEQILKAFSDAFNSEFLTIKRAEQDFPGRSDWLSTLDAILNRELLREVGPVKKLKEVKTIEGKRLYDKKTPGDFEKITRKLSEAVAFRSSLFELEKPSSTMKTTDPLGHLIIQYFACGGDFPIKLNWRSNTHERIGRKEEESQILTFEGTTIQDLDKIQLISESIVYDKFEKVISDVGGIKFDGFWTERDLSTNIFFLPKFSFTEDILKKLKELIDTDSRKLLGKYLGPTTADLFDVWRRAELGFNLLVFEIRGFDQDEDKKFIDWIKQLKIKQIPGPNYNAEKEVIEERHYRPF